MTQTASRCLFTEGSITLPEGYLDQTANLFRTANIAAPLIPYRAIGCRRA